MAAIQTDYSQFYRGTQQLNSYGSAGGKDTLVRYQFNTTDEEGNKVMDRMSGKETIKAMNEISSHYGSNVIVEFSGDGLAALEEFKGKGKIHLPEEHKEIPEDMITFLEGPKPLTAQELAQTQGKREGTDLEAVMHRLDPDAYQEYEKIKKEGLENGTPEGITAGFRYMYKWITQNAQNNPDWMERYNPDGGIKDSLSEKYRNADIYIGDIGDKGINPFGGDREFRIILSTEEAKLLKNGSREDKERLLSLIDDSMKSLSELKEKLEKDGVGKKLLFGISIGKDSTVSFLAKDGENTILSGSAGELLEAVMGSNQMA